MPRALGGQKWGAQVVLPLGAPQEKMRVPVLHTGPTVPGGVSSVPQDSPPEKPQCTPTECLQSSAPHLLSPRGAFGGNVLVLLAWLGLWENPLQGLVASSLISAQQKFSLEVSLSPSGGITITQRRSPQPLRVPPGPTMSRDPLPERTMRTGMAPKGPRWDRG